MKKTLSFLLVFLMLLSVVFTTHAAIITRPTPPPTPGNGDRPGVPPEELRRSRPWKTYATSEGPLFLSYKPKLTQQKLMFTPMDLSVDGEYSFPLIAAGSREIGQVEVKVAGGLLTAHLRPYQGVRLFQESYNQIPDNVQKRSSEQPMLFFLPDIASVTTVKPGELQHLRLPFDVPVDVVGTLAFGDARVLMYVYAMVEMAPGAQVKPFKLTDPGYLERVEALKLLMD